jgi:hypothetical protein
MTNTPAAAAGGCALARLGSRVSCRSSGDGHTRRCDRRVVDVGRARVARGRAIGAPLGVGEVNKARIAGVICLLVVFVTRGLSLGVRGSVGSAAGVIAGLLYIAVTLLFYHLFKPVNRRLSLLAAFVSLAGVAVGRALKVSPLPFFGIYCLLIGYLIHILSRRSCLERWAC